MTQFKTLVREYAKEADSKTMEMLTDKIDWFVDKVMEKDKEMVEHFIMKIDLLLNPHFTKPTAEYVVSQFDNKDGSKGEHWSYEQTNSVMKSKGLDYCEADWYYVMSMIYSDYYKSGRSDETYIELACDFLDDPDAPDCKAKKYWLAMNY